ncbi:RagB/SusD family nutrient uptake outer membrane protein [Parapedobacter sp. 2B3]|uniref:RagB/SusD family nutrient uptake outer membrane protein n=1 Tax=Parapedobacter sp. 2B3 TaxID=3342381 RepID=UPI0035B61291
MKTRKISHIIATGSVLVAMLLFASCEKFLEEQATTSFSADFIYNTPEGLELGVVSLYNLTRGFYQNGEWNFTPPFLLQAKDDLVLGRAGEASLYSILSWGATLGDFGTTRYSHYWRTYYRIIDRANALVAAAETIQGMDPQRKNQLVAEARTFRARSYFILYKLFNNIYVTTEPTTPENALDIIQDKSSEAEIFALINDDLSFAVEHLEWTTTQYGRLTQGTARHIKAQVALWEENWQEAKNQAEAVINSPYHALVGSTAEVFSGDLNHSETLFAMQYKDQTFGGGTPHRFNFLLVSQYGATPGAAYDNLQGGRGAGFLLLNEYFRDLLNEDPNDDRKNGSYYRMYYTYNDPTTLPEGATLGDTIRVYDEFSTDVTERNLYYTRLNPSCVKFMYEDGIPTEVDHPKNIMVYRLAETYLIAAEANYRISGAAAGLPYINAIRRRAHAAELSTMDIQTIMDEDARELGFEGQRWYLLKRLGTLVSQLQQYAGNARNGDFQNQARTRIQPHMVNLPIPLSEMNLLGPAYPQNDGYN